MNEDREVQSWVNHLVTTTPPCYRIWNHYYRLKSDEGVKKRVFLEGWSAINLLLSMLLAAPGALLSQHLYLIVCSNYNTWSTAQ